MGIIFPIFSSIFISSYKSVLYYHIYQAGCVIAGIIVGLLSFIIGNILIIKNINIIGSKIKELSLGKGDLTISVDINSNDSIGNLCKNYNEFLGFLKFFIIQLLEVSNKGSQMSNGLRSVAEESLASIENIVSIINSFSDRIRNIDNGIEITKANKDKLLESNDVITTIINKNNIFVNNLSSIMNNLLSSFKIIDNNTDKEKSLSNEVLTLSKSSKDTLTTTITLFDNFSESAKMIVNLIAGINEVAEKSKLLALNAAIEATRAGESGKGFRIVAGEIKTLSDTAKSNAAMMNNQINIMINILDSLSGIITQLREAFDVVFNKITDNSNNISEISENIKSAFIVNGNANNILDEMKILSEELNNSSMIFSNSINLINNSSNEISIESKKNKIIVSEILNGINEIKSAAEQVTKASLDNSEITNIINAKIMNFKTE